MRSAPPVLVPVGRFVWGERSVWALALLSLCLGLLWLVQQGAGLGAWLLALPVWLGLAVASVWCWRRELLPAGRLSWDGEAWWFEPAREGAAAQAVALQLVWDGQSALGLHVQALSGRSALRGFAWLSATDLPGHWHGVRCAVHATVSPQGHRQPLT